MNLGMATDQGVAMNRGMATNWGVDMNRGMATNRGMVGTHVTLAPYSYAPLP